jgi:hypothetical protein
MFAWCDEIKIFLPLWLSIRFQGNLKINDGIDWEVLSYAIFFFQE